MGNDESSKEKLIRSENKNNNSNNSLPPNNSISNQNFPNSRNIKSNISKENSDNSNNNSNNINTNINKYTKEEDTAKTLSIKDYTKNKNNVEDDFYLSKAKDPSLGLSKNFISSTTSAIIKQMTEGSPDMELKTSKFNGITIVQNLREYFPSNISKDKVKQIIISAFGNKIVEKKEDFIRGKNVTKEQAVAIVEYVYKQWMNHIQKRDL